MGPPPPPTILTLFLADGKLDSLFPTLQTSGGTCLRVEIPSGPCPGRIPKYSGVIAGTPDNLGFLILCSTPRQCPYTSVATKNPRSRSRRRRIAVLALSISSASVQPGAAISAHWNAQQKFWHRLGQFVSRREAQHKLCAWIYNNGETPERLTPPRRRLRDVRVPISLNNGFTTPGPIGAHHGGRGSSTTAYNLILPWRWNNWDRGGAHSKHSTQAALAQRLRCGITSGACSRNTLNKGSLAGTPSHLLA